MRTALARLLSVVGHPFATMLVLATVGTAYAGGTTAMLVTAGMILPVAALIVQRRRSGQWRTVDASDRHDRPLLFAVAGTAAMVVLAALLLHGNLVIARWMASVLLIIGTAAFLNRHFKTSLHMAFAAFAGISLFAFAPRLACGALAMLPFLAWSRLHLQRHTHAEILAGTGLGAIAALVAVAHL